VIVLNIEPNVHITPNGPEKLSKKVSDGTDDPQAARHAADLAQVQDARARKQALPKRVEGHQGDQAEFSALGQALSQIRQMPDVRMDKVLAVREAIARNEYDDPAKLDVAIDRLLEDIHPATSE
jgi:hypothetical protein